MKNLGYFLLLTLLLTACKPEPTIKEIEIDKEMLLSNLKTLSSDTFEGRGFATSGNYKAQQFIANQFNKLTIEPAMNGSYIQEFSHTIGGKGRLRMFPKDTAIYKEVDKVPDTTLIGGNVVATLKGSTNKVIVITGHLDHLGIRDGKIYNGADDDASGTVALFSIANYFKKNPTKHTLVFAAVDGEEIGSPGCKYLVDNFPGGIENVILNINMDMIAHNDSLQIYASGLYHNPQLKEPLDNIKSPITLLYGHDDPNDKELDDWTNSSDHRVFHNKGIPFIYFGVEDHKDYHKSTDTFENINQNFYVEAVKLIIQAIEGYDTYLIE